MSEFNEKNWAEARTKVFERAVVDPTFRNLCLTDPVAAVGEVSDIELPTELKLQFFDTREDYIYAFLLPPAAGADASVEDTRDLLIRWNTYCTEYTTG